MIALLRLVRGLAGVLAILQLFGMAPVLGWLQNPHAVTGDMWAMLAVKLVVLAITCVVFFLLYPVIQKIHARKHGNPHPALSSKWSF